ncbi:MAG: leucine-rich repeat domain-containing protein [Lachnospiraceae bacterium]|nr:leucine-rich repeat domain-containing protein [Lachnospiraceae bacterium]
MKNGIGKWMIPLLLLSLVLAFTGLTGRAYADGDVIESGACGDGVTYMITTIQGGYELTISGSGKVTDSPWNTEEALHGTNTYRTMIRSVVIEEGITKLPDGCFSSLEGLRSVSIPGTLTEIPFGAFKGCLSLMSVDLNQVTRIREFAFENCDALQSVTCASVTKMDRCVFQGSGMKEFTVPASVPAGGIDSPVFTGAAKLTMIYCAAGQTAYESIDGILYTADGKELIAVPANYQGIPAIPDSVEVIDLDAFPERLVSYIPDYFGITDKGYAVMETVSVSLTERYDLANLLLTSINGGIRSRITPIMIDAALSDTAMTRAAEISVHCDKSTPIRPDGTRLSTTGEYIFIYRPDEQDPDVTAIYNGFIASGKCRNTLKSASYKGIGIGIAETGGIYYCVIEVKTAAGSLASYQSGSVAKAVPIRYAKYLLSDAALFHMEEPVSEAGKPCPSIVWFGNGEPTCVVETGTLTFSSADRSIVTVDEGGCLYAAKAGQTEVTAKLGFMTCTYTVTVQGSAVPSEGNAIATHACAIGESFGINYYVPESVCGTYDECYLSVTKPYYEGNAIASYETEILRSYVSETIGGAAYRVYCYRGITAKEMTSEIKASLTGVKNGQVYQYAEDTYSIGQYVDEILASGTADAGLKRVLADMLAYGTEAQNYFSYHKAVPASGHLTSALASFATQQQSVTLSSSAYEDTSTGLFDWYAAGFSLSANNRISFNFYVNGEGEPLHESAEITIGGVTFRIPASDWVNTGEKEYRITLSGIALKECRTPVGFVIKKNGAAVSGSMTVSMEIYAALAEQRGFGSAALTRALVGLGDSLEAYVSQ